MEDVLDADAQLGSAQTRSALYTVLASLADNKYVLGRRYAEWCTGAPVLESAIAAAAMAQDELGHARWLYPLLSALSDAATNDGADDSGWADRQRRPLTCLDAAFGSWYEFVTANLVLDSAFTILVEAATASRYRPLGQRAAKIAQEETAHWQHALGWVRRLSARKITQAGLAEAMRGPWLHAFSWFGQADDSALNHLRDRAILSAGPDELRRLLRARLQPPLEAAGAFAAVADLAVPWDRWDPAARRLG